MKTFAFDELDERGQNAAINRYYADSDYQNFIEEVQKERPEESPSVGEWASERGLRFNEHGERIA